MTSPTILIVEDDPMIVTALEFLMEQNEYNVFIAENGDEALEKVKQQSPNLMLLDVMLPGRSGLEICSVVKEKHPTIKIVLLTAKGRDLDLQKGLAMGADAYVTKPFSNRELVQTVQGLLNS